MRFTQSWLAIGTVVIAMALPSHNSWAKSSLESRVERVEAMVENQLKVRDLNDLDSIRQQLQELRGTLEEYQHELGLLRNKLNATAGTDTEQGSISTSPGSLSRSNSSQSNSSQGNSSQGNSGQSIPIQGNPIQVQHIKIKSPSSLQLQSQSQLQGQDPTTDIAAELPARAALSTGALVPAIGAAVAPNAVPDPEVTPNAALVSGIVTNAVSTAAAAPGAATGQQASEQAKYDAAYKLIEAKKYQTAQTAFQDFLWQYPESKYVANVHYWLGEIYLSYWHSNKNDQLQVEKAISSFKTVVAKYPQHNKAVDCLLKLGLTEMERENWIAAREYLTAVINQYPDSSRAKIASMRLETLQEQGLI